MAAGMLPGVLAGAWMDQPVLAFALLPVIPVLVALTQRPADTLPAGPTRSVGRTLGHWWAVHDGRTVYLRDADARALLEQIGPREPDVAPTLDGFVARLDGVRGNVPAANWFVGTAHRAMGLAAWLVGFLVFLEPADVIRLTQQGSDLLPVIAAGPAMLAGGGALFEAVLGAAVMSVLGSLCFMMATGVMLVPYQIFLAMLLHPLRAPGGAHEVELKGRVVSSGGQRFHLTEPDVRITRALVRGQTVLVLESARQRLEIPGPADELCWLAQRFAEVPRGEGSAAEVPEALSRLSRGTVSE